MWCLRVLFLDLITAGCHTISCRWSDCVCYKQCFHCLSLTHTRLTALFLGLPGWASTRMVKPIWILLKQETVSGSGISWAICKFASRSRQITMPVPHHSSFLQAGCPSCRPTNSVKALIKQWLGLKIKHTDTTHTHLHFVVSKKQADYSSTFVSINLLRCKVTCQLVSASKNE